MYNQALAVGSHDILLHVSLCMVLGGISMAT